MVLLEGRIRRGLALGSAWAALCGAIASGGFHWGATDLFRLAAVVFLTGIGWASVWVAVTSPAWAEPLRRWAILRAQVEHSPDPPPTEGPQRGAFWLPYLRADAPGGSLARWLAALRTWWVDSARAVAGPALNSLLIAATLSLLLATLLGPRLLLLTLAAFASTQLAFALSPRPGQPGALSQAMVWIGLPWLAGHVAFSPLNFSSAGLALAYSLAYTGLIRTTEAGRRTNLALLNLGQALAVAILLVSGQVAGAGIVGLLAFPMMVMQPWLGHGLAGESFVRRAQWPLMLAMLVSVVSYKPG